MGCWPHAGGGDIPAEVSGARRLNTPDGRSRWRGARDAHWNARRSACRLARRAHRVERDMSSRFYRALVLNALTGASYWFTYSWLPEYLRSRGLTLAGTGTYIAVIVCAEIVGYSLFGFVSDLVGRRPTFTAFAFTMAVGLLPLTLLWDQFASVRPLIFCAMALVGIGTGIWSNFGPMLAELFPTETRNTAMGSVFNLARAAQLGAPLLIA